MRGDARGQQGRQGKPRGPWNPSGWGRVARDRWKWTTWLGGNLVAYIVTEEQAVEEEQVNPEHGPSIRIVVKAGQRWVSVNLTAMTSAELEKFHEVINAAIELAVPVVQLRDRIADAAFNEGDDSFARLYRQVPNLNERPGPRREYDLGLQWRLENPSGRVGGRGGDDGGVRDGLDELAQREPEASQPEDDAPPLD